MAHQFTERIIRRAGMARPKRDSYCAETRRCPGKQHITGNKRSLVAGKCLAQLRTEEAECAHVFGHLSAYGRAERKPCDAGCEGPHQPVLLGLRRAVNNVASLVKTCEQARDFFRRML